MFATYRNRWCVVFASMLGLVVVSGTINVFGFAVFLKPVCGSLSISHSTLASGVLMMMVMCGLGTPIMGVLADRYGSRRILLAGIPLFAASIASLGLLRASPVVIYLLFAVAGGFGAMHNTVPYAKAVSKWFDRERGLALGIAMAGIGFGIAGVPQIAKLLIQSEGWRLAYAGVGAMVMLFAFVPVLLFVREPDAGETPHGGHGASVRQLPGLTFRQAAAGWRFWTIGAGFFVAVISTNGTLSHVIAMLTDRGISATDATAVLSTAGIGVVLGRLICGWSLDRFSASRAAPVFFAIPAVGIALLAADLPLAPSLAGVALCGVGLGAHVGMLAFFASRYFGLRAYGRIYGTLFGAFLAGSGTGPFLNSLSFDLLGSYQPALIAFATALLLVGLLFLPLGAYPFAAPPKRPAVVTRDQAQPATAG